MFAFWHLLILLFYYFQLSHYLLPWSSVKNVKNFPPSPTESLYSADIPLHWNFANPDLLSLNFYLNSAVIGFFSKIHLFFCLTAPPSNRIIYWAFGLADELLLFICSHVRLSFSYFQTPIPNYRIFDSSPHWYSWVPDLNLPAAGLLVGVVRWFGAVLG